MPSSTPRAADLSWEMESEGGYRPSWSGSAGYINDEHAHIGEANKGLPGGQDSAGGEKLYEMAYHAGEIILAVGTSSGRIAAAALLGAIRAHADGVGPPPRFYGIDADAEAIKHAFRALGRAELIDNCLLYVGNLAGFHRDIPITPTMVFVGGEHTYAGVFADLRLLRTLLAPGTPVLCHDYAGIEGVSRAVDELVAAGLYEAMGRFGCSVLLKATQRCGGRVRGLRGVTFESLRDGLSAHYLSRKLEEPATDSRAIIRGLTRLARVELSREEREHHAHGYSSWPYGNPESRPLPPTLPDGRPWPMISIVTPSFNQGRYIEQTILSIANQGYPNVEHIVIDGGSTDETLEVIERHRHRLTHLVSEPDNGQGSAINKGFNLATGEILTWLNSDDMLAPGALAAVALGFHAEEADIIAGVCQIHSEGELIEQHLACCENEPLPLDDLLDLDGCWLAGQFFYQPEVMFSRAIWERAGGRVDESLHYSMDYELWLRFAEHGARLAVIGRPVAIFRVHEKQKTSTPQAFEAELAVVRDAFLERTGRSPWRKEPCDRGRTSIRVTFFNDTGGKGGAGVAHERLAKACALAGHDVTMVWVAESSTYDTTQPTTTAAILSKIEESRPDLVVVGNLHSAALDPRILARIAGEWPMVLVAHDQWGMTGRCAYTGDCDKYLTGCDDTCPTPDEYPQLEPRMIAGAWEAKRRAFSGDDAPVLLANSRWTADFLRRALATFESSGVACEKLSPVEPSQLAFPLDVFFPRDKRVCRELLGLPRDRFIIMTSAGFVDDPRKGIHHLARALERLNLPDVLVVSVGRLDPSQKPPIPRMRLLGHVDDQRKLAMAYSAADLYVGPSLEEAFGLVYVEAAACGTPAIGYPIGGVPESITDGITGRIADSACPEALADVIEECYRDAELRTNMGSWARLHVENQWSLAAGYRRFFTALARTGLREKLGLRRKILLRPHPPKWLPSCQVDGEYPRWKAIHGFGPWEGPHPKDNLPRCRWALGPTSRFEMNAERSGRHALFIECRNYWEGQRVRLVHDNRVVREGEAPVTGNSHDHVLHYEFELTRGRHQFDLHTWQWDATKPEFPAALIITSISLVPAEVAVGMAGA